MALATAPSTNAIMGAVPRDNAGMGSAVNDTTREVGGAIGIAVVGTLLATGYRSAIGGDLARPAYRRPDGGAGRPGPGLDRRRHHHRPRGRRRDGRPSAPGRRRRRSATGIRDRRVDRGGAGAPGCGAGVAHDAPRRPGAARRPRPPAPPAPPARRPPPVRLPRGRSRWCRGAPERHRPRRGPVDRPPGHHGGMAASRTRTRTARSRPAGLTVTFHKVAEGHVGSWWEAVRPTGGRCRGGHMPQGRSRLPHDLVHMAAEGHLGIDDGVWGLLARGATFRRGTDQRPTRTGRALDPRPPDGSAPGRARGQRARLAVAAGPAHAGRADLRSPGRRLGGRARGRHAHRAVADARGRGARPWSQRRAQLPDGGRYSLSVSSAPCGSRTTPIRVYAVSSSGTTTRGPELLGPGERRVGVGDRERHAPVRAAPARPSDAAPGRRRATASAKPAGASSASWRSRISGSRRPGTRRSPGGATCRPSARRPSRAGRAPSRTRPSRTTRRRRGRGCTAR